MENYKKHISSLGGVSFLISILLFINYSKSSFLIKSFFEFITFSFFTIYIVNQYFKKQIDQHLTIDYKIFIAIRFLINLIFSLTLAGAIGFSFAFIIWGWPSFTSKPDIMLLWGWFGWIPALVLGNWISSYSSRIIFLYLMK